MNYDFPFSHCEQSQVKLPQCCSIRLCAAKKGHCWYWSAILIVSAQEKPIKNAEIICQNDKTWTNTIFPHLVLFLRFSDSKQSKKLCLITNFHLAFVSAPDIFSHWDRFAFSCNLWGGQQRIFFIRKSDFQLFF